MQFFVPHLDQYDPRVWSTAYVSGIEGIPWAGHVTTHDQSFSIQRSIDESGRLSVVWPNREFGASVVSTASLRCQEQAYCLPVELARGTLHRVRQRAFEWQRIGLKLPDNYGQAIESGLGAFLDAVLLAPTQPEEACLHAQNSIEATLVGSRSLSRAFVNQILQFRMQQEKRLGTLLGVRLDATSSWRDDAGKLRPAVNSVYVQPAWHFMEGDTNRLGYDIFDDQIEWARQENLRIIGGPLVSLQPHAIQHWMYLLNDFDSLYSAACQFTQRTVERYRGRVHIWNVATGLNSPNDLGLSDDQVLQLAVGIIQTTRRADPKTPVALTVDMPWAEYLGQRENSISPLHFADALVRADLGLSGIALEMNMNFWPNGTLPRDFIDISDLIDHWSILGIPLIASITSPSDLPTGSPNATASQLVSTWKFPGQSDLSPSDQQSSMASYALELIQVLLAKQTIHGIFWNHAKDRESAAYPSAGLLDLQGVSKSLLDGLSQIRARYGQ